MDGLRIILVVLLGVLSCSHDGVTGSVLEVTVTPGDNITLYCDCKLSTGIYIVWFRNCSHENQPPLLLQLFTNGDLNGFPNFQFMRNYSSNSYDLLIRNITDSDEGLYYCGTKETKVEDKEYITSTSVYRYSSVTTRVLLSSDSSGCISTHVPVSWMKVFTPAFTILSSFISFILVYHFCQKTDKETQIIQKRPDARGQTRRDQDEDMCFTRVVFWAKEGQTHQ